MIKYVLFDLDETLFDFQQAEAYAFNETMKEMNLICDDAHRALYNSINSAMWKALERNEITKDELKQTRFKKYLIESHQQADDKAVAQSYTHHLSMQGQLIHGAKEVLEQVTKIKPCCAATNGIAEIQKGRLKASGIEALFMRIFISEEMNCKKPEKAFFDQIFDALHCTNEEVILIGDSLTADMLGGENAKIQTIWYNPAKIENNTKVHPTFVIHDLHEIIEILTKMED